MVNRGHYYDDNSPMVEIQAQSAPKGGHHRAAMFHALPPAILVRFRKPLIILAHAIVFAAALMFSFLLIHNMQFKKAWMIDLYPTLIFFFLVIKLPVFGLFKQYQGWWRYVGIADLVGIVQASFISTLLIVSVWYALGYTNFARTYLPIGMEEPAEGVCMADLFATIMLLGSMRMILRLYFEASQTIDRSSRLKRFLIVGAGNAGEALIREIHRMPVLQYEVIGLIDDDPAKQKTHIHGIPVIGTVAQLPEICAEQNIEEIAIAMPSAARKQLRRVIQVCEGTKIRFRTVPSITDIVSGKLRISQIRDVDISDLLGREEIQLELDSIETFVKDKVILVTGAGGSIGSEMCRQLCHFNPKLLLLVEQAENPLFYIERELRKDFTTVCIEPLICNITDKIHVEQIFAKYKPEVVIHAAAHKHVPLMELNPSQAIKNNVMGTKIVADTAEKFGTLNFVMISTDKAVNPTSIMGSSKRIAEMYIQDLSRTSKTLFVTVRFGNVLGSEGSVIPIFKKQIAEGGPVTVTHPEMKRYFMTIPEASKLVLQAATMGKGGEIFVLEMGEPVKIVDLARELITLSGFSPEEDIEIKFTNPRPGEKLFEELSIEGEDMQRTRHSKISIWKNIPMDRDKLREGINELIEIASKQENNEIFKKIKSLVPEYSNNLN